MVYGVPKVQDDNTRDWSVFREIAKLQGKDDTTLTAYYRYVELSTLRQGECSSYIAYGMSRANSSLSQPSTSSSTHFSVSGCVMHVYVNCALVPRVQRVPGHVYGGGSEAHRTQGVKRADLSYFLAVLVHTRHC